MIKTTSLKVCGDDIKLRLFSEMYNPFSSVCSMVKDKLNDLKEDERTLPAYTDYIKQINRGRGCATTVFGGNSTGEYAKKYKSLNVFPLYKQPKSGPDFTSAGYNYSATASVHIQLDSLDECDKLCNGEFNKLKKEVEGFDKELHEKYGEELVSKFYQFIEETMLLGWSFDKNFQKFFNQLMFPSLQKKTTLYKGTYKIGDKSKRYSFYSPTPADLIASNSQFWQIMSDENSVSYFESNRLLQRKKEHAEYTKTTLLNAPVRPIFGNNGIKFSISCDERHVYMLFRFPSVNGNKPELLNIPCNYQKYYFTGDKSGQPKNSYLSGLKIIDNKKGTYTCQYSVNNKRPKTAILKECSLRLKVRNHSWFNKFVNGALTEQDGPIKSSYFDFYFDLSLGVVEEPIHDLNKNEINKIRAHYSSAYPEIKELKNQSTIPIDFKSSVDKPHRLMGVDLGQRNPFAYCVKNNDGTIVSSGYLPGATNDTYKKYIEFKNNCSHVIRLIKESKNYLYGDEDAFDVENYNKITISSLEDYKSYLRSKKHLVNIEDPSRNKTHTMRVDKSWMVKEIVYQLTKQYHILNKERYNDNDWKQTLYWIDAIYCFVDLQKSYNNFGSYYDHKTKIRVNGTGKGFGSSYYEHINNLNKDTFKKFSFELLNVIKEHGVSIVCLESLTSMYGDKLRSSNDNRMYNLWPVGQLKTFLEGVLEPYNVAVIEVSEQDTSQIIDDKWSKRDGDVLTNGEKIVHSDVQAATNIVDRALTNHTNLYSLYMINVLDDYWVPNQLWSPKETGGKRIRGFLTKLYGKSNVVFIKKNNKLIQSTIDIKKLKKLVGKNKPITKEYMYRVNDVEWIDGVVKEHLVGSICEPVGDKIRLQRIKFRLSNKNTSNIMTCVD